MIVNFKNIKDFVIPMIDFQLNWRFIDKNYNVLPDYHLKGLKPLGKQAAKFLFDYIKTNDLHGDMPFKKSFFKRIDIIEIKENNENEVKNWLFNCGLNSKEEIFLSWDNGTAMIVSFGLLIEYFDDFYYSSSDNLTVFQENLDWALLFFHADQIYFGSNKEQ